MKNFLNDSGNEFPPPAGDYYPAFGHEHGENELRNETVTWSRAMIPPPAPCPPRGDDWELVSVLVFSAPEPRTGENEKWFCFYWRRLNVARRAR